MDYPSYYTDPYFTQSQDLLFPFYSDILKGDIPDYYAPIGEWGGKEFEDFMGYMEKGITKGVTEDLARRKVRGARGGDIIAKAVGDIRSKYSYEDMLRGLKGRESLLGVGTSGMEGVRSSALAYGSDKSRYDLDVAKLEEQDNLAKDKMWTDILSSVIGGGVSMAAMSYMPLGSAKGGKGLFQSTYDIFKKKETNYGR